MSLQDEFQPAEIIEDLRQDMEGRMMARNFPPEDVAAMGDFLARMAEVASQLIFQEGEIQIPNTDQRVPYNAQTSRQTMWLFCEGMYYGLIKTWEMGTPDELKAQFLQNVAQYVFENAKQVVVSTYGQENTPGFEIEESQQVQMVTMTAESALLFFINEYEKANGSINNIDRTEQLTQMLHDMDDTPPFEPSTPEISQPTEVDHLDTLYPEAPPAIDEGLYTPPPPAAPPANNIALPSNPAEEKMAALALLLNTLSKSQREGLTAQFNAEQQEKLRFYSVPENIEQHLNIPAVITQLKQLKKRFKQLTNQSDDRTVQRRLKKLMESLPQDRLLQYVKNERPNVQMYLRQLLDEDNRARRQVVESFLPFDVTLASDPSEPVVQFSPPIEAVVYRYLAQKVG